MEADAVPQIQHNNKTKFRKKNLHLIKEAKVECCLKTSSNTPKCKELFFCFLYESKLKFFV